MKTGIELIAEERARQISSEGWTAEHDDAHRYGQLAMAAAAYALPGEREFEASHSSFHGGGNSTGETGHRSKVSVLFKRIFFWPWDMESWKPCHDERLRELVKAGALIAAEIDRLQRASKATQP